MSFVSMRTNIPALSAIHQLASINDAITQANQRITTGLRLNSSKDDPAGFAIATRMRARLDGLDQAQRNVQYGTSAVQTADSALQKIQDTLKQVKNLALQASDALLTTADRQAIQVNVDQLVSEIDRIASAATFNTKKLLDGSFNGVNLQVGPDSGNTFGVSLASVSSSGIGVNGLAVSTIASASGAITTVQNAINSVAIQQATTGSYLTRLDNIKSGLEVQSENETASLGVIQDADVSKEVVNLAQLQLRQQSAGVAISMAMVNQQTVLSLLMGR